MESSVKLSQKEYLRKYLSGKDDVTAKKKKKKKLKVGTRTVKIIDDDNHDIDTKNMRPIEDGEFEIFNTTEDAPQIVGVIDERGPVDFADKRRWKIIADDGDGNVAWRADDSRPRDEEDNEELQQSNRKLSKHPKGNITSDSKRSRNMSNDDLSPPRESKRKDSNFKPDGKSTKSRSKGTKKRTKESNGDSGSSDSSDSSPRRKSTKRVREKDKSVKESGKKNYDSDLSPPRDKKHQDNESNRNRRSSNRRDSESDQSPPRKKRSDDRRIDGEKKTMTKHSAYRETSRNSRKNKERSKSPEDFDSDLSPPRRKTKDDKVLKDDRFSGRNRKKKSNDSDSDLSPPRVSKKNYNDDKRVRNDSRYDRKERDRDEKKFRSRPRSRWNDEEQSSISKSPEVREDTRMTKTLDGKTAGLQDAKALKIETAAHKKREAELFKQMSAEVSGAGQAPVMRDRKTGRRRDLAAEAVERREKEKRQEEINAKYAKWGRGLKQVEDLVEKRKKDLHEMSKPLARYANDADLDKELREEMHIGDPMLEYMKKKYVNEGKSKPERPSYQGSYLPNRFGIKPGYRWDGVDRSNGYEKKWFESRNARTALEEEAYKWSTADM